MRERWEREEKREQIEQGEQVTWSSGDRRGDAVTGIEGEGTIGEEYIWVFGRGGCLASV